LIIKYSLNETSVVDLNTYLDMLYYYYLVYMICINIFVFVNLGYCFSVFIITYAIYIINKRFALINIIMNLPLTNFIYMKAEKKEKLIKQMKKN